MFQTLTLNLPTSTYQKLLELAQQSNRPLEEETLDLLQALLEKNVQVSIHLDNQLEQLSLLTDEELWHAATTVASEVENNLMQILLEKQQREGLTTNELEQINSLSRHFNQIMLVRAKSAAILAERGHDISSLAAS